MRLERPIVGVGAASPPPVSSRSFMCAGAFPSWEKVAPMWIRVFVGLLLCSEVRKNNRGPPSGLPGDDLKKAV